MWCTMKAEVIFSSRIGGIDSQSWRTAQAESGFPSYFARRWEAAERLTERKVGGVVGLDHRTGCS